LATFLLFFHAGIAKAQWVDSFTPPTSGDSVNLIAIEQSLDGDIVAAGRYNPNAWMLKLKANGTIDWQKAYSELGAVTSMQAVSDGYILSGSGIMQLMKLNLDGSVAWLRRYDIDTTACPTCGHLFSRFSVRQSSDGGYIATTIQSSSGGDNFGVLKLNSNGVLQWSKFNNLFKTLSDSSQRAYSFDNVLIRQTSDGGFVLAGALNGSVGVGSGDLWLAKLDALGNFVWSNVHQSTFSASPESVEQTVDGGYIVSGSKAELTGPNTFGPTSAIALKFKANGDLDWQMAYGGNGSVFHSIQQTADGQYVASGVFPTGFEAMKLNTDGSVVWQQS
jgi:hypothetical protein